MTNTSSTGMARWRGKVALVTGATSGIGRAIAESLGRHGVRIAATGRRRDRLDELARRLEGTGTEVLRLVGDQSRLETTREFFRAVRERWGGVDILVNNAGVGTGRFTDDAWEVSEHAIDLNLTSAALCLREAVHDMRHRDPAAIIVISSMTAHRTVAGATPPAYAASKAALRVLTDGVRAELAQTRSRTKVAMISPGMVATGFRENRTYDYTPLQPLDVAEAALYVLSTAPHVQVCDVLLRSVEQVA